MARKCDFLVVGTGLAGLSFALKTAAYGKVILLSKTTLLESNTYYAQGGIAAVIDEYDSYAKHIQDTLVSGDGICNEEVVRLVVNEAPAQIEELIKWGTQFDIKEDGHYDLAREGGHSEHRVLHHKDATGAEIQRALTTMVRKHPNIEVYEYHFAIDLITQHHLGAWVDEQTENIECHGVYALNIKTNHIDTFLSRITLLATGGIGNVYQTTTNPIIATGDGISMVKRANGKIENMEFIQFHPTSLYNPNDKPSFLITEALRGHGAILRNHDGVAFMHKYDRRGDLAPRDIVARAIDSELKMSGEDYVWLDATALEAEDLKSHFPNITEKCQNIGIDITKQYIPVVPAAHYLCGGVSVDTNARTSISRLYAAGEVCNTGLHGANRLASNSLLEAIVYAARAADHATKTYKEYTILNNIPDWSDEGTSHPEEMVLITQEMKELQQIMSNYVGIVRSNLRLKRALDRLEILYRETEDLYVRSTVSPKLCELRNSINVAYLIIKHAKKRKESRGLHYNIDYPRKNPITK